MLVVPPSQSSRWPFLIMGAGLIFGLLAGVLVFFGPPTLPSSGGATGTPAPAPIVGAPAPDFALQDTDQQTVTLSSLRGQVVLLNFWATWCGPCKAEMPAIQQRYERFKDQGFTVLAVDVDEPLGLVLIFMREQSLTLPVVLDPGATVTELYRVRGFPTTFIIDREGNIAQLHVGSLSEGQLDAYLEKLGFLN